jgi:tRNA(adenine34) deaminase
MRGASVAAGGGPQRRCRVQAVEGKEREVSWAEFIPMAEHEARMRLALRQAERAAEAGEVPVGAVVYRGAELVGRAWNQTRTLKDPTAHAEMLAITQAAAAVGDWRLGECVLYVTKEPCPMCAGAAVLARLPLVVWGASDPLRGGAVSRFNILQSAELNHRAEVLPGVLEGECAALLREFFKHRREKNRENKTRKGTEEQDGQGDD